jgi:hypothetical protein
MSTSPASGERNALRGYRWQYDHVAALVYDALLDDDFLSLRLTDPRAGKVDDLVLVTRSQVAGHQFKSTEFEGFLTFSDLLAPQRTRSGKSGPSLLRALADGWMLLREQHKLPVQVHLVARPFPSVNDHLVNFKSRLRGTPDHFQAFIARVLEPLRVRAIGLADVPQEWVPALARLEHATGLPSDLFALFLQQMKLDLGARDALQAAGTTRRSDITELSDSLYRTVGSSTDVVELDRERLLLLMGWTDRPRLRSVHEFPVDLDTYVPLEAALNQLDAQIAGRNRGYIAIVGPPGSGKSTMISQGLSARPERVVRYYAYVPGSAPARTRLAAHNFLHDLVLMLRSSGLATSDRHLPSPSRDQLRHELHDQLDRAAKEYRRTGRRSIVAIDGLDHVERDYAGNDGLLAELPNPSELPEGIIVLVGTRTLTPLSSRARQQIEEDGAAISLEHHRLTSSDVIDICQRASVTAPLRPKLHRQIADISGGHPLALSYVFNRLRDRDDTDDPEVLLSSIPPYAGDIAQEYRALWDRIEGSSEAVADILAVCARLRIAFTTPWLATWAGASNVAAFRREVRYLFRSHHDGWHFFHDSFRQFVIERTALGDDGQFDASLDEGHHARIADLCRESSDHRVAAEELFHRNSATQYDSVLALGQQAAFRRQARNLRSHELIRSDIGLVVARYAERGDVAGLLSAILALIELGNRTWALDRIDLPAALLDAGLIDEAIGCCGGVGRRQVPLAHAYRLAERLGRMGRPEGRRLFDMIEYDGFDDPERTTVSGEEDDAAEAWGLGAPLFRPMTRILNATRQLLNRGTGPPPDRRAQNQADRQLTRYAVIHAALIQSLSHERRVEDLMATDAELARAIHELAEASISLGGDSAGATAYARRTRDGHVASLIELRARIRRELLEISPDGEGVHRLVEESIGLLNGLPHFEATALDIAELAARYGFDAAATQLLRDSQFANAVSATELSQFRETESVNWHFRYWRLRYILARRTPKGVSNVELLESIRPNTATPAGNDIDPSAPVHMDVEAIKLADRIDAVIRILARLDAAALSGAPRPEIEVWTELERTIAIFGSAAGGRQGSATLRGILYQQRPLMRVVVRVADRYGRPIAQRLADELCGAFASDDADRWPLQLQLDLAQQLREMGVAVLCYPGLLAKLEAAASNVDVTSRLEEMVTLIMCYASDGHLQDATRLGRLLIPMAFGVGYRKDYQFSSWVKWLQQAIASAPSPEFLQDAAWMARLLVAVRPMTEGAPASAAANLPAAAVAASPVGAVRIFEFLVREGGANHLDAVAKLTETLLSSVNAVGLQLAADFVAEVIAPASDDAYPALGKAIRAAAQRLLSNTAADSLVSYLAERTDMYALPTTRLSWRDSFGVAGPVVPVHGADNSSDDFGDLLLNDGRRFSRKEVPALAPDAAAVLTLRAAELSSSHFDWTSVIVGLKLESAEVTALARVFCDGSERGAAALASLAEHALKLGDFVEAHRLAELSLRDAPINSWSWNFGTTRRRAHAVAIASGGKRERRAACQDLAAQLVANRWFAGSLTQELADIVVALDSSIRPDTTWPFVREYLSGVAETLHLLPDDVLSDRSRRWWIRGFNSGQRASAPVDSSSVALTELVVGHLAHPTWLLNEAATRVVARALVYDNQEIAEALARLPGHDAADDILEAAGRCLAAARVSPGYTRPECLQALEIQLASHRSQVLRDLVPHLNPRKFRPLSPLYRLEFPPAETSLSSRRQRFLAPHEAEYDILAKGLGLNPETVRTVAERYANRLLRELPEQRSVLSALELAGVQHTYPSNVVAASRGAFGRVLADFADAQMLEDVPEHVARLLRTVDLDLITDAPLAKPAVLPPSPSAGVDHSIDVWLCGVDRRLLEYIEQSHNNRTWLIGARCRVTVLNWGHLEEEVQCGLVEGQGSTAGSDELFATTYSVLVSELSDPDIAGSEFARDAALMLSNHGWSFHQLAADWLAFRPDVAVSLGWLAEPRRPGRWSTKRGELAVESIRWVDGWWGRAGPAFDDTESDGWAVVASEAGLADITAHLGPVTRVFHLSRWGRRDGQPTERVHATASDAPTPAF